jgi:hypothetical protein
MRWDLSHVLEVTTPCGVPMWFRVAHALFVHKAPFINQAIRTTNLALTDEEWRGVVANEFVGLLDGGPFLQGSKAPSLADLSAFPLIALPLLRGDTQCFLPGHEIEAWVHQMKQVMPNYRGLLPDSVLAGEA